MQCYRFRDVPDLESDYAWRHADHVTRCHRPPHLQMGHPLAEMVGFAEQNHNGCARLYTVMLEQEAPLGRQLYVDEGLGEIERDLPSARGILDLFNPRLMPGAEEA